MQTRFSYFGQSGWRSPASIDPTALFDPARLEARFMLYENITLPSLRAQSDDDFYLHILSSDAMPSPYQQRLQDVTSAALGTKRVKIFFKDARKAGRYFRSFANRYFPNGTMLAQIVLDDDDAVADGFAAAARHAGETEIAAGLGPANYRALSFPRGLNMALDLAPDHWFLPVEVPFINLGLIWLGPAETPKNAYMTRHLNIPKAHPHRLIPSDRPMFIRSIHGHNDSLALTSRRHLSQSLPLPQITANFSWLDAKQQMVIRREYRRHFPAGDPLFIEDAPDMKR